MADPFQVLEHEHRLITGVLDALASAVERDVPLDFYARALEFLDVYGTQFHHAKEEHILYRHLIENGMPRDYGPLGVVLEEHDYGDAHLAAMRAHLEARDVAALREEITAYVALLRGHVRVEDDLLLPMGRAMLTAEEIVDLARAFDAVPSPKPPAGSWEEIVKRLCAEVEVPA